MLPETRIVLLLVAALLTACNDGHSSDATSLGEMSGQLVSSPTQTASFSPSDLLSLLTGDPLGKELLQPTISPICNVTVYHVQYQTVGGAGEATQASAALMIPSGVPASCQGARPIVVYAHG